MGLIGRATSTFWMCLPAGVVLAKIHEMMNRPVAWDYTVMAKLAKVYDMESVRSGRQESDLYGMTSEGELVPQHRGFTRVPRWAINVVLVIGMIGTALAVPVFVIVLGVAVVRRCVVRCCVAYDSAHRFGVLCLSCGWIRLRIG